MSSYAEATVLARIQKVRDHPGMFFDNDPTSDEIIAFLAGFNFGALNSLSSLPEWLAVKAGICKPLVWWELAKRIVFGSYGERQITKAEDHAGAFQILDLVIEYLQNTQSRRDQLQLCDQYMNLRESQGFSRYP